MITMVESYMLLDKKLNTYFNNLSLVETHSSRPTGKESHRPKDELNRGMQGRYYKYTSFYFLGEDLPGPRNT